MERSVHKNKVFLWVSLGIILVLILAYFFIPEVKQFLQNAWDVLTSDDKNRIQNWVSQFGILGPIVIILAMTLQMFLFVVPTILLMIVSVLAYGPVGGSAIILISVFVASSVGYLIGRKAGEVFIKKILGSKTENNVREFIKDYGFWAVAITRFNPFLSNDAISFVAGFLKMNYWKFMGATFAGIVPLTAYLVLIGTNMQRLQNGLLWGSLIALVLFGLYIYWDKKIRPEHN